MGRIKNLSSFPERSNEKVPFLMGNILTCGILFGNPLLCHYGLSNCLFLVVSLLSNLFSAEQILLPRLTATSAAL